MENETERNFIFSKSIMKVPTTENEITKEYLNEVLKGFPLIKTVTMVKPKTHGMMSNVRLINLEYEEAHKEEVFKYNPSSLVIKYSLPTEENFLSRNGRDIMKTGGLYQREVQIYDTFSQLSNNNNDDNNLNNPVNFLPYPYYTQVDEIGNFVIIMEHVKIARKNEEKESVGNDLLKSATLEQSRLIVSKLAKFHATFWHNTSSPSEKECGGILKGNSHLYLKDRNLHYLPHHFSFLYHTRNFGDFEDENIEWARYSEENLVKLTNIFDKTIPSLLHFINDKLEGEEKEKFLDQIQKRSVDDFKVGFKNAFQNMFNLSSEKGVTLVHGDFRFDNMIFYLKANGENDVSFVDWQCISVGNGLLDLASFLHNSLSFNDLADHEDNLLQLYFDQLKNSNSSLDVTLEDIKYYYKSALWYEVLNATETAEYVYNLYLPSSAGKEEKQQLSDRLYERLKRTILLACPRVFS